MNLQAIIVANLTGFLLIMFLYFSRFITRTKSDTEEHAFDVMMGLAMIACVIEPITFAVDGIHNPICYWVNIIGNTYLYYANGLGSFLWLLYEDMKLFHDRSRMKRIYYKISVPVSILLLSLIGNIKFGYYFYVDDNYVYHRQTTIYIFYVYMMLCALYSIGLYLYYKKHHGKKLAFFPIYMYLIPIVTGSVIQMLYYGVSTAWLGTAVGVVALYMSLQQQRAYTDTLTGLYNRLYLEHAIFKINRRASTTYYGMMLDMNDFKLINDTHGHSAGDQALKDVAQIFNDVLSSNSTAFRYAGDEFIIVTKTDDEQEVIDLEAALKQAADDFNNAHKRPYKLSFAIGHSMFNTADSEDSILKRIDDAMYLDKKRYHASQI